MFAYTNHFPVFLAVLLLISGLVYLCYTWKPKTVVVTKKGHWFWASFNDGSFSESIVDVRGGVPCIVITAIKTVTVERVHVFYESWPVLTYRMCGPLMLVAGDEYALPLKLLFEQTSRDCHFATEVSNLAKGYDEPRRTDSDV